MKSLDYWIERGKRREAAADRECRWVASEIGSLYQAALRSIQSRITKLYRRYTEGYGLTPEQADALLSVQQTKAARQELEDLLEQGADLALAQEIRARLDAPAYAYRISRLEALRDQVYFDAKSVGMAETAIGEDALADVYKDSYYRTAFDQSQELGENVPFEHLDDPRAAEAVWEYYTTTPEQQAQNYSNRVWRDTEYLAEQVREIVTEGLMTGGNYQEMAEKLDAAVGTVSAQKHIQPDGTTRTVLSGRGATYRATRLIRTEGNRLSGQAVLKSLRDAGVERYIYRALLEVRTCKVCGALDGKDFPVAEAQVGTNMHPMHPNCRCFIAPYHDKEWLDRHKRNAQGAGQVPQSMTFQEWKKKFVEKQKEAEAKAKAESETEQIALSEWEPKRRKHKTAPKVLQQTPASAEAATVEVAPPAAEQGAFTEEAIPPESEEKKTSTGSNVNYEDITDIWFPDAVPGSHEVKDLTEYTAEDGTTYIVDGHNVVLDYSAHEKEIAELLEREVGGEMYMVPKVYTPRKVRTPDYLFNQVPLELKTISESGKNTLYNRLSKAKGQAKCFVLDLTDSQLNDDEITRQIAGIYRSTHTEFVDEIVIIKSGKIKSVYKRK